MPSVYDPENFIGRVNFAAAVIARRGTTTRMFDACFEMNDGDAVVAALARRAKNNPKLRANILKYLVEDSLVDMDKKYEGQNLTEAARQLRNK